MIGTDHATHVHAHESADLHSTRAAATKLPAAPVINNRDFEGPLDDLRQALSRKRDHVLKMHKEAERWQEKANKSLLQFELFKAALLRLCPDVSIHDENPFAHHLPEWQLFTNMHCYLLQIGTAMDEEKTHRVAADRASTFVRSYEEAIAVLEAAVKTHA